MKKKLVRNGKNEGQYWDAVSEEEREEHQYELTTAVFEARVKGTDTVICVMKYCRIIYPLSKGVIIPDLKSQIEERNYTDVKFRFWANNWEADGGHPQEFKMVPEVIAKRRSK